MKQQLAALLVACVFPVSLCSAETGDRFTLHGFGTLGLVHSNTDEAEFIRDISQSDGVADGWDGNVDSRLGLQFAYRASNSWDAIVQLVSRYNTEGNYQPEVSWAFLRYSPSPDFQLRLGRVGLDSYMLADSKDVGYSYLWMRPPTDYYGNRHLSHVDGADLTFKRPLGEGLGWIKVYGGTSKAQSSFDETEAKNVLFDVEGEVFGGHANYAIGPWHLQLAHSRLEYEMSAPPEHLAYIEQVRMFLPALADNLAYWLQPVDMRLSSAGLAYSGDSLQVQAMYNLLDQDQDSNDVDSAFATAGYRIGKVTPYLTWSAARTEGISLRELGLSTGDEEVGFTQSTLGVGARYDFASNMALKLQFDRANVKQSGVVWRKAAPGWSGDVSLFSVGIDFVF